MAADAMILDISYVPPCSGGAAPLVRGRRPRRPAALTQVLDSSSERRDEGVPRGPGGPPHSPDRRTLPVLAIVGAGAGDVAVEQRASQTAVVVDQLAVRAVAVDQDFGTCAFQAFRADLAD